MRVCAVVAMLLLASCSHISAGISDATGSDLAQRCSIYKAAALGLDVATMFGAPVIAPPAAREFLEEYCRTAGVAGSEPQGSGEADAEKRVSGLSQEEGQFGALVVAGLVSAPAERDAVFVGWAHGHPAVGHQALQVMPDHRPFALMRPG